MGEANANVVQSRTPSPSARSLKVDVPVLYLFTATVPGEALERLLPMLPPERRTQALSYRFSADRGRCVLAYALLMHGLQQEYGIKDPPRFYYGPNGKPYLVDYPGLFFNLTHSKSGVACAIAEVELGIDIETIAPVDLAVAELVCTSRELANLIDAPSPTDHFCRLWTLKEAHIKRYGGSIADAPNEIESAELPYFVAHLSDIDSYLCSTENAEIVPVSWRGDSGLANVGIPNPLTPIE